MKISQALYRARQFWSTWHAQTLTEEELAPAHSILTAAQMELFSRLQPSEQIHALRVLQTIHTQRENDPDLQTAALLHDVGKARAPLNIWERVVIVLGKGFFPKRAKVWGTGQPRGWKRSFVVAEQHAAWGAEMASEAGTSPLAVSLIRRHQSPYEQPSSDPHKNRLLKILQEADHQN
jgi:putative nucleotidyltransferase with HDIG domain